MTTKNHTLNWQNQEGKKFTTSADRWNWIDHVDLKVVVVAGLTVAEHQVINGGWNVAGIAHRAYDLEGKIVRTVGAGRIGRLLLQRLKLFNCNFYLLCHDRLKMDPELESQIEAKFEEELDNMLSKYDIVFINIPIIEKTKGMFDKEKISKLKKGVLIVDNARGAIMDTQPVVDACNSGHIVVHSYIVESLEERSNSNWYLGYLAELPSIIIKEDNVFLSGEAKDASIRVIFEDKLGSVLTHLESDLETKSEHRRRLCYGIVGHRRRLCHGIVESETKGFCIGGAYAIALLGIGSAYAMAL
ncbi:Formate dehydrogenase, mitochondrial [Capsicum baccatum]|uniref:Formate dehydrogenase, mitochondrial n=1 Tax=Capsicum baccatum TaxID=33114 RepID=A0A2G2WJN0_CAPBA|nr:Formate dehydrogenase, mitochondrial [Capsicum baccatum]